MCLVCLILVYLGNRKKIFRVRVVGDEVREVIRVSTIWGFFGYSKDKVKFECVRKLLKGFE